MTSIKASFLACVSFTFVVTICQSLDSIFDGVGKEWPLILTAKVKSPQLSGTPHLEEIRRGQIVLHILGNCAIDHHLSGPTCGVC